jgi:hypothetical protein
LRNDLRRESSDAHAASSHPANRRRLQLFTASISPRTTMDGEMRRPIALGPDTANCASVEGRRRVSLGR